MSWRLWVAKKQASLSAAPEFWLAELEQIERLIDGKEAAAAELVERYLGFLRAYAPAGERARESCLADGQPSEETFLYGELAQVAHFALIGLGPEATEALLKAYQAGEPGSAERDGLLRTLVERGDPDLEGFFRERVDHSHEGEEAKRALSLIEQRRSAVSPEPGGGEETASGYEHFLGGLRDENYFTRWRAAEALGELGDPRAVEPLCDLLADPNGHVRGAAQDALKRLGCGS